MVKYILMIVLYLVMYLAIGTIVLKLLKREYGAFLAIVVGFFCYHGLFQIVTLPMILLKKSLTTVTHIWIICMVIFAICMFFSIKIWMKNLNRQLAGIKSAEIYGFIAIVAVVLQLYFMLTHHIVDMDSSFYIGTANTALYTDTMHIYSPYTGKLQNKFDLRYALATFSIHSAVMCKIFNVAVVQEMRVVVGSVNIIMSNIIIYLIGYELFKNDKEKASAIMVALSVAINMVNYSIYTSSWFLMARAYEGKAYCANVILPFTFLICIMLIKNYGKIENWILLFIVTFACNTISMSSMLTVPVMITGMLLTLSIREKNIKVFFRYLICILPCVIIVGVYFLSTIGIIKIAI